MHGSNVCINLHFGLSFTVSCIWRLLQHHLCALSRARLVHSL